MIVTIKELTNTFIQSKCFLINDLRKEYTKDLCRTR